ncbi:GTP:adenosylcobinamide-phosphate guanylyltransferase [Halalkaliarchaeum sp. AArc-CO]|nr:GTP:adenosylcobinamide-phosphate guanylyltransferase [Halalkaliarchaeum sp. AArc-CO]
MCGGQGTRLESDTEKPLVPICGVPMVDRVREALRNSRVDRVYAVVSPHAPETTAHLDGELPCIETPGNGYVSDLQTALQAGPVEPPVLTAVADLPLLASQPVNQLIAHAREDPRNRNVDERPEGGFRVRSATTVVPAALKRELEASIDGDTPWIPAGLNVVAATETEREDSLFYSWDARLAVNVNRKRDVRVAERLCTVEEP